MGAGVGNPVRGNQTVDLTGPPSEQAADRYTVLRRCDSIHDPCIYDT